MPKDKVIMEKNSVATFYAPDFEKSGGHVGFGVSVCVGGWVRDIFLKLHVWIPQGKVADA